MIIGAWTFSPRLDPVILTFNLLPPFHQIIPYMEQFETIYQLGVAIAIGLLMGLQREYVYGHEKDDSDELFAGARTFALFAILGFLAALTAEVLDSPIGFVVIVGIVGLFILVSYAVSAHNGSLGLTTEAAALITVAVGAMCYWDQLALAASIGVLSAILLAAKVGTQSLVKSLTPEDIYATLKFAFISIIVLPLLPRDGLGPSPFDVLSPFNIWLMVVFISGISFLGYALIKIVGMEKGIGLTGFLGGLASSTAVTMSFAQKSRDLHGLAQPFALAILISWTVMIARVAIEVLAVNAPLMQILWVPVLAVVVSTVAYSAWLYLASRDAEPESVERFTNPFELWPALIFGLLYAVVLLGSNAAQLYFGDAGIYLSSVLSGLVDVDAITLSMARLSQDGGSVEMSTAARAIMLAVVSNTVVKGGLVLMTASSGLKKYVVPGMLLIAAAALISVFVFV